MPAHLNSLPLNQHRIALHSFWRKYTIFLLKLIIVRVSDPEGTLSQNCRKYPFNQSCPEFWIFDNGYLSWILGKPNVTIKRPIPYSFLLKLKYNWAHTECISHIEWQETSYVSAHLFLNGSFLLACLLPPTMDILNNVTIQFMLQYAEIICLIHQPTLFDFRRNELLVVSLMGSGLVCIFAKGALHYCASVSI